MAIVDDDNKISVDDKRYVFVALNKKLFDIVKNQIDKNQMFFSSKATLIQFLMNCYLDQNHRLNVKVDSILKELEQVLTQVQSSKIEVKDGLNKILELFNSLFLRI